MHLQGTTHPVYNSTVTHTPISDALSEPQGRLQTTTPTLFYISVTLETVRVVAMACQLQFVSSPGKVPCMTTIPKVPDYTNPRVRNLFSLTDEAMMITSQRNHNDISGW
jgi:hypothetical protein